MSLPKELDYPDEAQSSLAMAVRIERLERELAEERQEHQATLKLNAALRGLLARARSDVSYNSPNAGADKLLHDIDAALAGQQFSDRGASDAARWQWWRKHWCDPNSDAIGHHDIGDCADEESLDAAIDAQIAAECTTNVHGRCIVAEKGLDDRCQPGDCPTPTECTARGPL